MAQKNIIKNIRGGTRRPRGHELTFCRNIPRKKTGWLALGLAMIVSAMTGHCAESGVTKEDQVKAAFIYNFTKFVEWPAARLPAATTPIVIGVVGVDAFADELARLTKGRQANGHGLVIKRVASVEEARTVHVLYVSADEETQFEKMFPGWLGAGLLTVGESERFAARGGIITFTLQGDKVRFTINLESGEAAGLKISAQLLKLASSVHRKS